ncbi:hypothetical protein [Gemmata massiliana]|nr:hypothetical protein [Gemmata massiliana]
MPTQDDATLPGEGQRASVQLADAVYFPAMSTLAKLCDFREAIFDAMAISEQLSTTSIVEVLKTHAKLVRSVDDLGAVLEIVSGWWIADQPPTFAPECISVAEAILLSAAHVTACLSESEDAWFATVQNSIEQERIRLAALASSGQIQIHRFVTPDVTDAFEVTGRDRFAQLCDKTAKAFEEYKDYDEGRVGTLMRCEAAAMARRESPQPRSSVVACGNWSYTWGGVFKLEDVKEWAFHRVIFSNRGHVRDINDGDQQHESKDQDASQQEQPDSSVSPAEDVDGAHHQGKRKGRTALVAHPKGSEAKARIKNLRDQGMTWRRIAEAMNLEYPLLTGNPWTFDSVRNHLQPRRKKMNDTPEGSSSE